MFLDLTQGALHLVNLPLVLIHFLCVRWILLWISLHLLVHDLMSQRDFHTNVVDVEKLPEEEFTFGVSELFDLQLETFSLFFLLLDLWMVRREGRHVSTQEKG